MAEIGFDSTIGALNTSLNLRQLEQNVISSNLANAETPGYKQKAVEFESAFRNLLLEKPSSSSDNTQVRSQKNETDAILPEIFEDPDGVEGMDGNTVNKAQQMALMAQNQVMYDASVEMLKKKLGFLKYAITEGMR